MKPSRVPVMVAGGLFCFGCGGYGSADRTEPSTQILVARDTVVLGVIHLTGSTPLVTVSLSPSGARDVTVTGPFESELVRLSGATVSARGDLDPRGQRLFTVASYDVVAINGERPIVGILRRGEAGEYVIEHPGTLVRTKLDGVVPNMTGLVGAKIWILGPTSERGVRPQSVGIIRSNR